MFGNSNNETGGKENNNQSPSKESLLSQALEKPSAMMASAIGNFIGGSGSHGQAGLNLRKNSGSGSVGANMNNEDSNNRGGDESGPSDDERDCGSERPASSLLDGGASI